MMSIIFRTIEVAVVTAIMLLVGLGLGGCVAKAQPHPVLICVQKTLSTDEGIVMGIVCFPQDQDSLGK